MKIVSLRSIGLDQFYVPIVENDFTAQFGTSVIDALKIKINEYFPETKTEVTAIHLITGDLANLADGGFVYPHEMYYLVSTLDKHVRMLPERAYVAEWAGETND